MNRGLSLWAELEYEKQSFADYRQVAEQTIKRLREILRKLSETSEEKQREIDYRRQEATTVKNAKTRLHQRIIDNAVKEAEKETETQKAPSAGWKSRFISKSGLLTAFFASNLAVVMEDII